MGVGGGQRVTGGVTSGFIVLCEKGVGSVQGPPFGLPCSWEFCSLVITWHIRAVGSDPKALFGAPLAALLEHWAVLSVTCVLTLLAREGHHSKDCPPVQN